MQQYHSCIWAVVMDRYETDTVCWVSAELRLLCIITLLSTELTVDIISAAIDQQINWEIANYLPPRISLPRVKKNIFCEHYLNSTSSHLSSCHLCSRCGVSASCSFLRGRCVCSSLYKCLYLYPCPLVHVHLKSRGQKVDTARALTGLFIAHTQLMEYALWKWQQWGVKKINNTTIYSTQ